MFHRKKGLYLTAFPHSLTRSTPLPPVAPLAITSASSPTKMVARVSPSVVKRPVVDREWRFPPRLDRPPPPVSRQRRPPPPIDRQRRPLDRTGPRHVSSNPTAVRPNSSFAGSNPSLVSGPPVSSNPSVVRPNSSPANSNPSLAAGSSVPESRSYASRQFESAYPRSTESRSEPGEWDPDDIQFPPRPLDPEDPLQVA